MGSDTCGNVAGYCGEGEKHQRYRSTFLRSRRIFIFADQTMIACFLLMLVFVSQARTTRVWPGHYSDAHRDLHRKLLETTHRHLEDLEIVVPFSVDDRFQYVSHQVRHRRNNRIKRDVADDVNDGLRYALSGFGQEFLVHLEPNHRLLSPTFSVKRIKRNAEEVMDTNESSGCHYQGRLTSHGNRAVAMSTCDGLTGLLRTEEDDFLVEPIPTHLNHSFDAAHHPHVIYKRKHLNKGNHRLHYCGKKRRHPVHISASENPQTIKLLSNGAIALEDVETSLTRRRRSLDYPRRRVGYSESDFDDIVTEHSQRPKSKFVETLVVVDHDMIKNHERDRRDVTTYVLTVMNMVHGLFSDHTLDEKVNVVLVGLILLEDNQGLHLDHRADKSLSNFCRWQVGLNHSENRRPDHAILLTGIDICVNKNSPCETLGLAQIGGMCSRRDSCTINEDMGLGLAFTVAHESGHSFGMMHDGQNNFCSKRDGHIMSPTLNGLNGVFTWSTCSREALDNFLNDIGSVCLDNQPAPVNSLNFPNQLPGEIYGAESQCQWQFGANTNLCGFRYDHNKASLCKILWCQREGSTICETKYMPAAEGTPCGVEMWCRRGTCVPYGSSGPQAVNGGWGTYGALSKCTRTCGGGVQFQKRLCNNPTPMYGGRNCDGKDKIYQLCNTQKCPPSQTDFRGEQCAEFNKIPYRRQYFTWVPFTKYSHFGRGQCELLCKAENYDFFDMLAEKVIDGTPCDVTSSDVCIQGKCEHVGCDNVLGSNATYDACGVCNGDNSTCDTITGSFKKDIRTSGYYEVVRIPKGARTVRIWEETLCARCYSYIAVKRKALPERYYLNGNWQVDLYGPMSFAGTQWTYDRKPFKSENLFTVGPLMEDIIVEAFVIARNPGIKFSYTLQRISNDLTNLFYPPRVSQVNRHTYHWNVVYSHCSKSCSGGQQTSRITCLRDDMTSADAIHCEAASKPATTSKQCNTQPCPARWVMSDWSECSRTCGSGLQTRQVNCKAVSMEGDIFTEDVNCATLLKPTLSQSCQQRSCPPQWQTGAWSKCSRECGKGIRRRTVRCRSGLKTLRKSSCNRSIKPKSKERCLVAYCKRKYQWFITAWGQCSATCGEGVQTRELQCSYKKKNGQYRPVKNRRCKRVRRPKVSLQKVCSFSTCPVANEAPTASTSIGKYNRLYHSNSHVSSYSRRTARWIAGSWQKCSVSCGGGLQVRAVKCLMSGQPSTACTNYRKPLTKRACNTYQCRLSETNQKPSTCKDNFSWCYLVPQHGQCTHKYFGVQCCKTCSSAT